MLNLNWPSAIVIVKRGNPSGCFVHNLFIAFFQKLYYNTCLLYTSGILRKSKFHILPTPAVLLRHIHGVLLLGGKNLFQKATHQFLSLIHILREVFKQGSIESLDQETLFTIQRFFERCVEETGPSARR